MKRQTPVRYCLSLHSWGIMSHHNGIGHLLRINTNNRCNAFCMPRLFTHKYEAQAWLKGNRELTKHYSYRVVEVILQPRKTHD